MQQLCIVFYNVGEDIINVTFCLNRWFMEIRYISIISNSFSLYENKTAYLKLGKKYI